MSLLNTLKSLSLDHRKSEAPVPVNFCARELAVYKNWKKPIIERIKVVDSLRLHLPSDLERRNLRIPPFLERVDVQQDNLFLMMCGGHNAIQFSITEMLEITIILKEFRATVRDMESLYHTFSKVELKKVLTNHQIESAPEFEFYVDAAEPPPDRAAGVIDSMMLSVTGVSSSLTLVDKKIINFHIKADRAIDMLISLQQIALSKYRQQRQATAAMRERLGVEKKTVGGRELDDEEFASTYKDRRAAAQARGIFDDDGSGRWLDTLLRKFHVECSHVIHLEHNTSLLMSLIREESKGGGLPVKLSPSIDERAQHAAVPAGPLPWSKLSRPRLDHFSAFLCCCAVGDIALCSRQEVQALTKLIHVSVSHGDSVLPKGSLGVKWNAVFSSESSLREFILSRPQSHWARSFFNFLHDTAMTEFSCADDDEYLYQYFPFISDIAATCL